MRPQANEKGEEVCCGFLASRGDPLKALELPDCLLDPCPAFVEGLGEVFRTVGSDLAHRDDGDDGLGCRPVALRIIALVGQDRARRDVRTDPEEQR